VSSVRPSPRRVWEGWETPRPLVPELALIAATIAYGSTFKIVQNALEDVTPVGYMMMRFGLGALVLVPFVARRGWRRRGVDDVRYRSFLLGAFFLGLAAFAGYVLQNLGLQRTTTSNSAFITGLFVVFTPLIETVATRKRPAASVMLAVAVSVFGLYLLEGGTLDLGAGDALTLGCAFFFGIWIFLGGELSPRFDPVALTAVQLAVITVLSVPVVAVTGLGHVSGRVVLAVVITGVFCSALAFSLQLWGQRFVEPSRAAVIGQFEPVVAGVIGFAIGERLGVAGYFGALVILLGIVIAESAAWRTRG